MSNLLWLTTCLLRHNDPAELYRVTELIKAEPKPDGLYDLYGALLTGSPPGAAECDFTETGIFARFGSDVLPTEFFRVIHDRHGIESKAFVAASDWTACATANELSVIDVTGITEGDFGAAGLAERRVFPQALVTEVRRRHRTWEPVLPACLSLDCGVCAT